MDKESKSKIDNVMKIFLFKIRLLLLVLLGEIYKILVDINILKPQNIIDPSHEKCDLVVSLTSYGRRVNKVYYTIISLLRQTIKPHKIILWLDYDHWNDKNLPKSLLKLARYGLEIKFCKDIKSYKKLVPTLQEYPDAMVVTCDDDIYYRNNMLERLVKAYKQDPTKIYAHRAHKVVLTKEGNLEKYNNWEEEISDRQGFDVFPTSGGGTLYTRKLLYKDVCNEKLFMKLSPKADDVWNYFMAILNHTPSVVLPHRGFIYFPLDVIYQKIHKGSNLSSSNCGDSMNDKQIKDIMNFYGLTSQDLNIKEH